MERKNIFSQLRYHFINFETLFAKFGAFRGKWGDCGLLQAKSYLAHIHNFS